MSKIAYIIVTFNGEKYIEKCISSIREFDNSAFIIVLDNCSNDNTLSVLDTIRVDFLIPLNQNLGFGKANNLGIKYAYDNGFEYYYLVNQDLYFKSGDYSLFIETASMFFSNNYGVISPLHLAPNEEDYDFNFFNYISQKNTPNLLDNINKEKKLKIAYESKAINAAAWLMSRKCIESVGLFDPIFHHYGEDTDYINRLKYHNYKIGVLPLFKVVHNRPQKENKDFQKQLSIIEVWSLSYLKNINKSYASLVIMFPYILFSRLKSNTTIKGIKKSAIFFKILFYLVSKLIIVAKHRNISKKQKAFFKSF